MKTPYESPVLHAIAHGSFKPLADRVLTRHDLIQTAGSLVLPPSAQYERATAVVLASGPSCPSYLVPGVRVLPHAHAGLEVATDPATNTRYVVYTLAELQLVFTEDATVENALEALAAHGALDAAP